MNFISKNMLAIALLLSVPAGLFGMTNAFSFLGGLLTGGCAVSAAAENTLQDAGTQTLSANVAQSAGTLTERVAPVAKDCVNGVGTALSNAWYSEPVQGASQELKRYANAALVGLVANAKVIVPATLNYAFRTWSGDGSSADIACSAAAKVAVGVALLQGYWLTEDVRKWWKIPADPRGYIIGFFSNYNPNGTLRKRPVSLTNVATVSGLALVTAIGMTS